MNHKPLDPSPSSSSDQTPERIRIQELETERDALRAALGRVVSLNTRREDADIAAATKHAALAFCEAIKIARAALADPHVSPTREET